MTARTPEKFLAGLDQYSKRPFPYNPALWRSNTTKSALPLPIFISVARMRREAADATSARLIVPFGDTEDSFTVIFDPETERISHMETMRYKEAAHTPQDFAA